MFNTSNIPELTQSEYSDFNRVRSVLDFSQIHISYHLDDSEWRDQLQSLGTLTENETEQSIHCSSSITQSFSNDDFTFSVNATCGVYLSEKGLFSNEFIHPEYSLKVHNKNSPLADLSGNWGDSNAGKSLLDLLYRNTSPNYPSEYDWKAMENEFRLELLKFYNLTPAGLMPHLISLLKK